MRAALWAGFGSESLMMWNLPPQALIISPAIPLDAPVKGSWWFWSRRTMQYCRTSAPSSSWARFSISHCCDCWSSRFRTIKNGVRSRRREKQRCCEGLSRCVLLTEVWSSDQHHSTSLVCNYWSLYNLSVLLSSVFPSWQKICSDESGLTSDSHDQDPHFIIIRSWKTKWNHHAKRKNICQCMG